MIKASYQGCHSVSSAVLHGDARAKPPSEGTFCICFLTILTSLEKMGQSGGEKGGRVQEITQKLLLHPDSLNFGRQP